MTRRANDAETAEIKALTLRIVEALGELPGVLSHRHFFDAMLYALTCTAKAEGRTVGELAEHLRKAMAMELD